MRSADTVRTNVLSGLNHASSTCALMLKRRAERLAGLGIEESSNVIERKDRQDYLVVGAEGGTPKSSLMNGKG